MRTREELAWAAGFFDGEGHTHWSTREQCMIPRFDISNTDRSLLERFRGAVGVGTIYGPYQGRSVNRKATWRYATNRFADVILAIGLLWSFLGSYKREQIRAALLGYYATPVKRRKR